MSFHSLITRKSLTRESIVKVLECIEKKAKALEVDPLEAMFMLDFRYNGIQLCYENYLKTKEIAVPFPDGLHLFVGDDEVQVEDVSNYREQAELTVKHLAVNATGAREDEIVTGVHNISKNAVLKLRSGVIPPSKNDLDTVRHFPELWSVFLNKLGSLEFFRDLTLMERSVWLGQNEYSGDYDISEVGDVKVDVLDVGSSKFLTIDPEVVSDILSTENQTLSAIREKFPRKPGSQARRHTLIFFPHFWKVGGDIERVNSFDGTVYVLETGKMVDGEEVEGEEITIFKGVASKYENGDVVKKKSIGVVLGEISKAPDYVSILVPTHTDQETFDYIRDGTSGFTAAGYKSLLQKIIRYAPRIVKVKDEDEGVDAEQVVCIVFTLLLMHPGSFVPDIQRFVSGQESALKRLLVSILEDSYTSDYSALLKLGMMSMIAQRINGWKLPKKEYLECLEVCTLAVTSRHYFKHDIEKGFEIPPFVIDAKNTDLQNVSAVLDEVKSFATDLAMTRYIAVSPKSLADTKLLRPREMKISHCIDQHWAPEIAYTLPIDTVEKYRNPELGSKPFADLFKSIFANVTGVNSRKEGMGLSLRGRTDDDEFVVEVKKAQDLVYRAKHPPDSEANEPELGDENEEPYHLEAVVSQEWIAGCVGPISIAGSPPVMVTLKPEDPYQLVAIRRPSRGMKDGTLTDKRTNKAIYEARKKMENGISMSSFITPPIEGLKGVRVYLTKDDEKQDLYLFGKTSKGEKKTWGEIAKMSEDIPVFDRESVATWDGLTIHGPSILKDAHSRFAEVLMEYDLPVLRRCLSYLTSHRSVIEIARLSKDGGGTAQAVMIEDVGACQILVRVCGMFPCGLRVVKGGMSKFEVVNAPVVWEVREVIKEEIVRRGDAKEDDEEVWSSIKDVSGRRIKTYQRDCLVSMTEKNDKGGKGHFLWLNVGMGKTKIVLSYLKHLIDSGRMPKYAIYTLPKSAIDSIIKEIKYFEGLDLNMLIPIKAWKKNPLSDYTISNDTLIEGHINLIEHDHLRVMSEELISKAHDSLVIIDEVHKALNDTKRTSVALELSRLSYDFVALTGTPVVDSNTYKLIWWLEQLVEFEVTDKNFWVAANGMIAKKVNTGKEVEDIEVVAEMSDKESKKYLELVPVGLGGSNPKPSNKDIMEAFEVCYGVCDVELVRQVGLYVKRKKRPVMVVVRNKKHQTRMLEMLVDSGVKRKDVLVMEESVTLTDELVEAGEVPDYKVALVPLNMSMGYDLTRMNVMLTSVYPSNNAVREQMRGRINRIIQRADKVTYVTVHCGILTYVLQKHKDAASLSAVLSRLADEV